MSRAYLSRLAPSNSLYELRNHEDHVHNNVYTWTLRFVRHYVRSELPITHSQAEATFENDFLILFAPLGAKKSNANVTLNALKPLACFHAISHGRVIEGLHSLHNRSNPSVLSSSRCSNSC